MAPTRTPFNSETPMTVEAARALLAKVDAAEAAGVEFTEEKMREFGYVQTEGGIWELPLSVEVAQQL